MKVIYFHQHFVTPHGAGAMRSYVMARRLIDRGHQVTMVCGTFIGGNSGLNGPFVKGTRRGLVDEINVIEMNLPYSNSDRFLKRTLAFLKFAARSVSLAFTEKYDILFATSTPLTAGIPGIFARWLLGKPFVFEVRDLWPELPRAMKVIKNPLLLWAMGILEWVCYHSAHRLIGLSPGIAKGIAIRGVPIDRIIMIPNSCDLITFANVIDSWRPAEIPHSDLMAVFAGTHGIANGLDALLDVAAVLMTRGRLDIKILLIGNGKLKSTLQMRAARENLHNVVFYEPVSKARIASLMASADIGLQVLADVPAFYFGTSPNKFFDYIAAGLPVIINYPGWLADMINKYECGFALKPNNPNSFADALEQAADDRHALKNMGKHSSSLAKAQFDQTNLANCWVDWVVGVNS